MPRFRTHSTRRLRLVLALLTAVAALAALSAPVSAGGGQTEQIINFSTGDPATDPGTEGIAVDARGNVYVSANTADGGQIWKVTPGVDTPEVVATLIPPTGGAGFGVLGLDLRGNQLLATAHTLADPELNGVWRINVRTGKATHIEGTEVIPLPNDLTRSRGSIYVTDSAGGAIWRIAPNGTVEQWVQDELLEGLGQLVPGLPIGANGIDAYRGDLFVANLEKGLVVEVGVGRRNAPQQPVVVAEVDGAPDGLEVDRYGRPHVVLVDANALVRIGRNGPETIIDDSTVLDAPSSLVFGKGRRKSTAYVVNFSIGEGFPDLIEQSDVGPSVVAIRTHR